MQGLQPFTFMNLFLRFCFFIFLFFSVSCSREEKKTVSVNDGLKSITLKSLEGKNFSIAELVTGHRASVFYFLMPGCPMCESYSLSINELDKKFSGKGISFSGIFASAYYSDDEINSYRNNFKIGIPVYRDIDSKLAHTLEATVTPEVFILDSTAAVLYKGSIDNLAYATGKTRLEATEFFLNDALENIISGKPVAVKETVTYGCIIE